MKFSKSVPLNQARKFKFGRLRDSAKVGKLEKNRS